MVYTLYLSKANRQELRWKLEFKPVKSELSGRSLALKGLINIY